MDPPSPAHHLQHQHHHYNHHHHHHPPRRPRLDDLPCELLGHIGSYLNWHTLLLALAPSCRAIRAALLFRTRLPWRVFVLRDVVPPPSPLAIMSAEPASPPSHGLYDFRVLRFLLATAHAPWRTAVTVVNLSDTPVAHAARDTVRAFPSARAVSLVRCFDLHVAASPAQQPVNSDEPESVGHRLLAWLARAAQQPAPATPSPVTATPIAPTYMSAVPRIERVYLDETDVLTADLAATLRDAGIQVPDVQLCTPCHQVIPSPLACRHCAAPVDICPECEDDSLNCDCSTCATDAFLARVCSRCRLLVPWVPVDFPPPPPATTLTVPVAAMRAWAAANPDAQPGGPRFDEATMTPIRVDGGLGYFYCPQHRKALANCPACYQGWACPRCGVGYCWSCWNDGAVRRGRLCVRCTAADPMDA
ncbi:hypothetical protein AMAG_09292 [Allomyces macrogynus ATCC 38327]|uniref:F-box domain-containing protein n=1 Tax=Allomyces macrogynus (strain ATCC 38327) TaxID=578462 RepID=A0A0L0SP21_ALLM3|nr:hypothetical protein, variant [Allomyces macrogynus ATCC 38327]KNE64259.1 hypothetical protein AMAG_09292 [Allomyces macrogynus ATCC 38327]|eukprot:KNE64258.1 hypothetical protein, variant [Allomyces macrogynus ATCC 38327]